MIVGAHQEGVLLFHLETCTLAIVVLIVKLATHHCHGTLLVQALLRFVMRLVVVWIELWGTRHVQVLDTVLVLLVHGLEHL